MSFRGSVEIKPRGSQPAAIVASGKRRGLARVRSASGHEPGPIGGRAFAGRKTAPAERSASEAGRPRASVRPGMVSPAEWATMNQTGVPAATIEPIIDPADVPTMRLASIGSQPVSVASA
jgi:hypothetical protein